jgi:hypothetical protein
VFSNCILCCAELGANDQIERFPVGRKLAFDPERGRLWAICPQCGGWNLAPIEERWEPIEACEKLFRGTRVRISTANIGLAAHRSGLELIRIGRPLRPEFAAWRYAPRMKRRRRQARVAGAAGGVALAGLGLGIPAVLGVGGVWWILYQWLEKGWKKLDGQRVVTHLPELDHVVRRRHLEEIVWHPARGEEPWHLSLPLSEIGSSIRPKRHDLGGNEGMRLASLALNLLNRKAGSDAELRDAVDWIEVTGSPFTGADAETDPVLLQEREARRTRMEQRLRRTMYVPMNASEKLADLVPYQRLAFELAANEDQERLFLTSHLWLLERHWREAERIAAIADKLLVPENVTEALDKLRKS